MRLYFWPIIASNVVAMTLAIGGDLKRAALFSAVLSLLASFGFLLNDLWDRNVDRVNKAGHFEHSDGVTIRLGVISGAGCLMVSMGTAFWLGPSELVLASLIATALVAYTVLLRRFLVIPTVLAALLAATPLWAPLVLWPRNVNSWHGVFIAALVTLLAARETLMDVRDRYGDVAGARDTMTTVFGAKIAKVVAVILTLSGGILLLVVVGANVVNVTVASRLGAAAVAGAILYLVVTPALGTLTDGGEERAAIQEYVLRSRAAMALLPLLNLFLWAP